MNQTIDFGSLSDEELKKLYLSQKSPNDPTEMSDEELTKAYQQEKQKSGEKPSQLERSLSQFSVDVPAATASTPRMLLETPEFLSRQVDTATKKLYQLFGIETPSPKPGTALKNLIPEAVSKPYSKFKELFPTFSESEHAIVKQLTDPESFLRKTLPEFFGEDTLEFEKSPEEITNLLTPSNTLEQYQQRATQFGIPAAFGGLASAATGGTLGLADTALERAGVSDENRELLSLPLATIIHQTITKGPGVARSIEVAKKPSGLPIRQFEKVKKPRKVSAGRIGKINKKLEGDFKKISDKIIEDSPIAEVKREYEANPAYKAELAEGFGEVENLAGNLPEKFSTKLVGEKIVENTLKKKGTGFAPSEYDKDFRKFVVDFLKETPDQEIGAIDLVKQYRKNNEALGEAYDPSRPYAYNRAKRDAILEYNRAISAVIDEQFPKSEFGKLFKETNKRWSEVSDVEAINGFHEAIFKDTIDFKKASKFFENKNTARPFKRALGEKGFAEYKQLMKDMLSSGKAHKMLKLAKDQGVVDLVRYGAPYLLGPGIGKLATYGKLAKGGINAITNAMLDKPSLTIKWRRGVNQLKDGQFKAAESTFKSLDKEVKEINSKAPKPKEQATKELPAKLDSI